MIEPIDFNSLIWALSLSILILLTGASYAFFFALGKLHNKKTYSILAYVFYFLLAVMAMTLAKIIHLSGLWLIIVVALLAGYLLTPYAILRLCHTTYGAGSPQQDNNFPKE